MYIYLEEEEEEEEEDGVRIAFEEFSYPSAGGIISEGEKPLDREAELGPLGSIIRIRLLFISRSLRHNSSISCKIHAIDSLRHPAMRACVH
jgi:hypothetical protein